MAEVIRMPRLSDTMEEGNIVAWLKKVGDKVSQGDILAEVETDKATMELESFHDGYLLYVSVDKGPVPVNDILAVIGTQNEDYKSLLDSSPGDKKETQKPEGNGKETKPEDLKEKDPIVEQKEKPVREKEEQPSSEGKGKSNTEASQSETSETKPVNVEETSTTVNSNPESTATRIKSSPLAKSIATKAGIDLANVKGTGDGGRIVRRDIETFVENGKSQKTNAPVAADENFIDTPLSQIRKTIAKRLVESKFGAPHFYLTMKVNMDKISDARKLLNEQGGLKISFNDFIIKACAAALKQHPQINSSWLGDRIRTNKQINIGVAVAVEEGLLVPVIFNANNLGLNEISNQVNVLAEKAKQKKLQLPEMQGNTFTVSNLGMFGIDEFTAIINPPDSAIMAIGAIYDELRMHQGNVVSSKVMKVTLSCDHRVIDGATGAKFLQTFKQLVENPVSMLV